MELSEMISRVAEAVVRAFANTDASVHQDASVDDRRVFAIGGADLPVVTVVAIAGDQRLYTAEEVDYYMTHPDEWGEERGG